MNFFNFTNIKPRFTEVQNTTLDPEFQKLLNCHEYQNDILGNEYRKLLNWDECIYLQHCIDQKFLDVLKNIIHSEDQKPVLNEEELKTYINRILLDIFVNIFNNKIYSKYETEIEKKTQLTTLKEYIYNKFSNILEKNEQTPIYLKINLLIQIKILRIKLETISRKTYCNIAHRQLNTITRIISENLDNNLNKIQTQLNHIQSGIIDKINVELNYKQKIIRNQITRKINKNKNTRKINKNIRKINKNL